MLNSVDRCLEKDGIIAMPFDVSERVFGGSAWSFFECRRVEVRVGSQEGASGTASGSDSGVHFDHH